MSMLARKPSLQRNNSCCVTAVILYENQTPFEAQLGAFDSVKYLKELIQKQFGVDAAKQTISFDGRELDNEMNVVDECGSVNRPTLIVTRK
jgi:hypothetical protein